MENEKKYFAKGKLNADDADFTVETNDYVNMVNCRRGTTDFADGAIGYVESVGSTLLQTRGRVRLISIKIRRLISIPTFGPAFGYVGWYVFLNNAYYAITSTEHINTGTFNYPPMDPPPSEIQMSDIAFRGNTPDEVIASVEPGSSIALTEFYSEDTSDIVVISDYEILPSGDNITIGNCFDEVGKRIIYCNWNSNGDHGIYAYDIDAGVTYQVLLSDNVDGGLNFDYHKQIHSCRVINGLFFWTDFLNQPRRININAGIKAYNPSYESDVEPYTLPLKQEVITVIRKPPVYPLAGTKIDDEDINTNLIKNNAFRFAGLYEYRDGERSTLSVQSLLFNYNTKDETFNAIELKLPFEETIDQDVQSYSIAVIYALDEKAFIVKTWNKDNPDEAAEIADHNSGTTQLTYVFDNNSVGEALSDAYKVKPYDSVPLLAETLERANNRLFLGRCLEGYDTPPTTTISARIVEADNVSNTIQSEWWRIGQNYFYPSDPPEITEFYIPYMPVFVDSLHPPGWYWPFSNIKPPVPPVATSLDLADYYFIGDSVEDVSEFLTQEFPPSGTPSSTTYSPFQVDNFYPLEFVATGFITISQILKSDSPYRVGVVFYDEYLRQCGVITRDRATVTTPDRAYALDDVYNYGIGWQLSANQNIGEIPDWAHYYGIVVTKSLRTNFFVQARADDMKYADKKPDGTFEFTATTFTSSRYGVAFNLKILQGYGQGYAYNEGDVIKVYIEGETDVVSLSVIGQDANYVIAELYDFGDVSAKNAFYEIYTPQNQQAGNFYWEVAQIYPITNDRKYSVISGTIPGDVYLLERISPPDGYITENMSPNDTYWRNWFTNAGRVQVEDKIGQQMKNTGISYSNTFIPGTKTNGLSTFDALDEKILPAEMGILRKLQLTSKIDERGNVMLAISEMQTASMYIGEVQLVGAAANAFVAQSPEVIGTVNILRGAYGTVNPESVTEFRGNVFWLDANSGKYIQYAANGLFPISNFKTTKYFKLFSDTYLSLSQEQIEALGSLPFVYTGIDPHNEEVIVTVPRVLQDPPKGFLPDYPETVYPFDIWDGQAKSLVYKNLEGDNSWQSVYSFTPENYCYAIDELYSFKDGILWLHNDENSWGNFYGEQTQPFICAVSNQMANQPKVYERNAIEGNLIPTLTYFYCQHKTYNQYSDLIDTQYEDLEGIYYSSIMNDKSTPGVTDPIINGVKLRTTALYVMLKFDVSEQPLQFKFYNISFNRSWGHTTV